MAGAAAKATAGAAWEAVIGLEIHVQLATGTKMFCGCRLSFGDPPNSHTCPVCLAHPGVLPVPNRRAIEFAPPPFTQPAPRTPPHNTDGCAHVHASAHDGEPAMTVASHKRVSRKRHTHAVCQLLL